MGNREYAVELHGERYSPVDISAMILGKLVAAAREQLGENIDGVVIMSRLTSTASRRKLLMFIVLKTISLATSTPLVELAESSGIRRI